MKTVVVASECPNTNRRYYLQMKIQYAKLSNFQLFFA